MKNRKPYTVRITDVDEETGWCSILVRLGHFREHHLGVVFGDVVHNLRCALDYTITALADASAVTVTTKHQFPIYTDGNAYAKEVGPPSNPKKGGPLGGITHGLDLVERLQPYNRQPDPEADSLWHISRFSNADKHREITQVLPFLGTAGMKISYDGELVDWWQPTTLPDWETDREFEVRRLRFARPYPSEVTSEGDISVARQSVDTGLKPRD